MFLSVLLLLLVSGSQATHYYGATMTYYPKETFADGSVSVVLRYKLSFHLCTSDFWICGGNCGNLTVTVSPTRVEEISSVWCQTEGIVTHLLTNNSPLQLVYSSGNWINNVYGITSWRAVTEVELKNRSDIGRPNTSPQTTILPALRVPSTCSRNITLLAFDPDGDEVKCRYANFSLAECEDCKSPDVLNLSSSCSLTFGSLSRSNDNTDDSYPVQLVMEDFSRENITLTQTDGVQEVKTASEEISKIPVQFALTVVPAVPSCIEGEYLPRFLPPTPDNGAHLYTLVNHTLEIPVIAEATNSTITELLFSGPYNVVKNTSKPGNATLTWTPSEREDGQSHAICFVFQASFSGNLFDSELRCVIVTVGNPPTRPSTTSPTVTNTTSTPVTATTSVTNSTPVPGPYSVVALNVEIKTPLSLESDYDTIEQQIKDEFIRRGLPPNIKLRLLSSSSVNVTSPTTFF
ncbi:uncharacterized protein LOC108248601 [Kryptolebias marmoratus]|uniref:uncharacterized protein LOC108248601 n=1 Tax=Kryptolebias marmoratus TaxID=37003 RepID=UPI0007F873BB|nr:uncharacterized protein LOC108248601 [Kryptolebias marmoratus]